MTGENKNMQELMEKYKGEVDQLSRYIPWFEQKNADMVAGMYRGQGTGKGFAFPVYDATLLAFINEVRASSFLDTNYPYIYTRYRLRTHEDEWKAIENATILDMHIIGGILSKYVLGGMTRSTLWKEAVQYEIFLRCLKRMKEIIEFWDKPLQDHFDLVH